MWKGAMKMKRLQKIFAMILTVCMVMSLLNVTAFAEEVGKSSDIQIVEKGGKMYYLADPENGEVAGADNFDVWTSKTIAGTDKEDEFEITLQVGTTMKAIPNNVAVVLVIDASSSMGRNKDGEYYAYWNGYKDNAPAEGPKMIDYAKEAAQDFVDTLVENAAGSEVQIGIVEFSNSAKTVLGWTDATENLETVSEGISAVDVGFSVGSTDEKVSYWITRKVSFWREVEVPATKEESFWVNGSYCSDDTHAHDDDCREAGHCSFEGCEDTDAAHTHKVECTETVNKCLYVDEAGNICEDTTAAHKHDVLECTYWCDGQGCNDDTPWHTHQRMIFDSDQSNVYNDRDYTFTHTMEDGSIVNGYNRELQRIQSGATNLEGGLMLARNLVNTGKANGGAIQGIDDVYVILLSDGNPTYHVNQSLVENADTELSFFSGERGGGNYSVWDDVADIVSNGQDDDIAVAEDIKAVADLYAILYGTSLEEKLGGSHILSSVTGAEWFKNTGTNYVGADAVFDSPEAGGLNTVFADIKDRIDLLAKAWVITDELGSIIDFGDNVEFKEFTLNGQYAAVTFAKDSKNTTISWSLGAMEPERGTGSMADPYIYTLKYKVNLHSAKDNVKETSLAYDADSTLDAVWTNNGASLQYIMADKEHLDTMTPDDIAAKMRTAAFDKPSVKGIYGDYEFIKKNGETGEPMAGVGFTLYDSEGNAYGEEVFSDSDGRVVFTNIPHGTYTLKETTVPDGMLEMTEIGLKESWGKVTAADGSAVPEVINNWKIGTVLPEPTVTATIGGVKRVNDGAPNASFTFVLVDKNGKEVDEAEVTGAGSFKFDTIKYTKANVGTHTYTIYEKNLGAESWTYDDSEFKVEVEVTEDGDGLKADMTYLNGDIEFENTYYKEPVKDPVKDTEKETEGDTSEDETLDNDETGDTNTEGTDEIEENGETNTEENPENEDNINDSDITGDNRETETEESVRDTSEDEEINLETIPQTGTNKIYFNIIGAIGLWLILIGTLLERKKTR